MAKHTQLVPFSAYKADIERLDAIVDVRRGQSPTPGTVNKSSVIRALIEEEIERKGIIVHIEEGV